MLNTHDKNEPLVNVSRWKILRMLIAAPMMGAAYVVFLPFVGFYLTGKVLWEKTREILGRAFAVLVKR